MCVEGGITVDWGNQGRFPGGGGMCSGRDIRDGMFGFYLILNLSLPTKDGSTIYKKVNKYK